MIYDRLTDELVCRIFGWRLAPGRYLKTGRSWETRHNFAPFKKLDHAFRLLDAAAAEYSLVADKEGNFTANVCVQGRAGKATGECKARTITLALAAALRLEVPK